MPVINVDMKAIHSLILIIGAVIFVSSFSSNVNAQTHPPKRVKRVKGVVKWFNDAKKFGFLTSDTGEDIFVDEAAANGRLMEGACVTFEIRTSAKGPTAKNIRKCPGGESPYFTKPKEPTLPKIPSSDLL
jgi:CspA family cold shock protein